jgi:hypothetical protein
MKHCSFLLAATLLVLLANAGYAQTGKATALTQNDMKLLQTFLEYASGVSGKLPEKAATLAALKMDKGTVNLVKAIEDGSLVLTGPVNREGVWAYEKNAAESGGFVLSNNGVEKLDAAAAKKRLGK